MRTTAGVVRGRWEHDVAVFRGIPYAEPPIGTRRFDAPVRIAPWDGTRDALKFGPPVPHGLTLNVWSPELGVAGLPVMVWIHGGKYLEGSTADPHQNGTTLTESAVVMVSMDYRVGVDGFAHINGAPDNRGILDQIAALQWVQDNAAKFGGDPGNVTIFGQSAGAGCIAALLVMPIAAGLFRRAIVQSMPGTYFSEKLAAVISSTIAAELGVQATVGELTGFPPLAMVEATHAVLQRMPEFVNVWGPVALTPTPFSPVVDGVILPAAPWTGLSGGAARNIDLLVGHTRDEFSLFTQHDKVMTDEQVAAALGCFAPALDGSGYRDAYPEATSSELYATVNSDWLFRMPAVHLADAHYVGGGQVWLYELCWSFDAQVGASHSLDFLLVLGTLGVDVVRAHPSAPADAETEMRRVSRQMRTDWVRFGTTGDPGWAPYDPASRLTRVYDADPMTVPYPEERSRRIWCMHQFDTLDLPI
ncbi:hypothetical protein A5724_07305 [Mycobacterium sp. ACS1612]|nr:carboxylesterase family protein [Mycobacterium sp. ACS1612]OBF40666.1 hypothetical protein A5724_07305 [Mycobacterium sp. ACS1612]